MFWPFELIFCALWIVLSLGANLLLWAVLYGSRRYTRATPGAHLAVQDKFRKA